MIETKNGKWVTEDNREFEDFNEAVLHRREIVNQKAISAGYTTEAEIKIYRKRYWAIRDAEKREKEKVKSK